MQQQQQQQQQQRTPDSSCRTTTLLCLHIFSLSLSFCLYSFSLMPRRRHDCSALSPLVTSPASVANSTLTRPWRRHGAASCVYGSLFCVFTICFGPLGHGKGSAFLLILLFLIDDGSCDYKLPNLLFSFLMLLLLFCSFPPLGFVFFAVFEPIFSFPPMYCVLHKLGMTML